MRSVFEVSFWQKLLSRRQRYNNGDYASLIYAGVRQHQPLDRCLYVAGPFLILPKEGSATSFRGITLLVCESPVPEPTGGICRNLCGPNVQTLVSCHLGVESDTPLVTIWNILCTALSPWLDKLRVRSIGAVMRFVYQHLLSGGEFRYRR